MISSDGYSIMYDKQGNNITITLPHAFEAIATTLEDDELAMVLYIVKNFLRSERNETNRNDGRRTI